VRYFHRNPIWDTLTTIPPVPPARLKPLLSLMKYLWLSAILFASVLSLDWKSHLGKLGINSSERIARLHSIRVIERNRSRNSTKYRLRNAQSDQEALSLYFFFVTQIKQYMYYARRFICILCVVCGKLKRYDTEKFHTRINLNGGAFLMRLSGWAAPAS
jgi:hypothetical protein